MRAIVTGRLRQRDYESGADGQKRTVYEVDVEDAGPSLRYASAEVAKATRESALRPAETSTDQWASAAPAPAVAEDQPPF